MYGSYVDWVGLSFYERDWDENNSIPPNMVTANIRQGGPEDSTDFYQLFSVGRGKPMLISETAAFDPHEDEPQVPPGKAGWSPQPAQDWQVSFKDAWIGQLYDVQQLQTEFPGIHAICYFHVMKREDIWTSSHFYPDAVADYRIPGNSIYPTMIRNPYFVGGRPLLQLLPGPGPDMRSRSSGLPASWTLQGCG